MKSRDLRRLAGPTSLAIAALAVLPLLAGALLGACDGEGTTSSKRVTLKTQITADDEVTKPFTNAYGWSITLSKAAVSIGALTYFDGAPIFSAARSPARARPRDALTRLLGVNTAFAHPGHYQAGNAMGQVLSSSSADLMQGLVALPTGEGVAGVYRSGRFTFEETPTGSATDQLGGKVVVLEGEARKETMIRLFRAEAGVDDVLDSYAEPKLEGCAFDEEPDVQADGTVTVHIKPSVWLDQAEFDDVPESADGKPVALAPDGVAFKAFTRGLKKGSAVVFRYAP